MRSVALHTLVVLAACNSRTERAPVVQQPVVAEPIIADANPPADTAAVPTDFMVTLARTACLGTCPVYQIIARADGSVVWEGGANVAAIGARTARIAPDNLLALDRALATAQFFERDASGQIPKPKFSEEVTKDGKRVIIINTVVAVCTDTSHVVITATSRGRHHTMDHDRCGERTPIGDLADEIDRLTESARFVDSPPDATRQGSASSPRR
ncbi:MAG: DUF6438 domain-containing protein [Kofleriaceae bacterium]